ncbi:MAG: L-2-amino-thiazoline-4-carboxylic acid hydrolase [Lachnospiraceae bacterium]|nr:L-2-amino-thiazoline-4-carboxylic acid hydrolase [Lachnospiraceae bacterium]
MGFNEKVHAYIAAKYYVYLKESFGNRGVEAFKYATRYYAEQRGRRMALRAIADGEALTYETYRKYGEWVNTEEVKTLGQANSSELISSAPDYEVHVKVCPWAAQFKEMGLPEAGVAYCSNLDPSIARGFSPDIKYSTVQTLHDHEYCIQRVENANLKEGERPLKKPDGLKSFTYHCAHSYWSYREISIGIFGDEGKAIAEKVLENIEEDYGSKAKADILKYEKVNFNINSPEL